MSGLWLHLRNSPIRYALPVLIGLDLAVLFLRNRYWIGVWPATGAAAQLPAYLIGVVVAGAAAWAASAPTRHALAEQLSAARVHPVRLEVHRLGATVILLLIPYLVGQAVAFGATARTFPPGVHLWLGYALLGLFVTLLAVAVGWACGKLLGPVFAALTAALGFLFLLALLSNWRDFIVVTGPPEVAVDATSLGWRLAAVVLFLLALLWLPEPGAARPHRRALALAPAVIPLLVVVTTTDAIVDRHPPGDDATCVAGRTTLCIWPEHEKYVPQLRDLQARIDLLPDAFVPPPRINEVGLETVWSTRPDGALVEVQGSAPYFHVLEGSPWSYAGDIATAINSATFGFQDSGRCTWWERDRLTRADLRRLWVVDMWLWAYLAGQHIPDFRTNAPADMQEAWSEGLDIARRDSRAEQFEWAAGEVSDLRGRYCQPEH